MLGPRHMAVTAPRLPDELLNGLLMFPLHAPKQTSSALVLWAASGARGLVSCQIMPTCHVLVSLRFLTDTRGSSP